MLCRNMEFNDKVIDVEADFYFVPLFSPGRMKMLIRGWGWIYIAVLVFVVKFSYQD